MSYRVVFWRRRLGCPLPCAIRLRTQRPDHMAVAKTVLIRPPMNTPAEGASDFHLATRADVQSIKSGHWNSVAECPLCAISERQFGLDGEAPGRCTPA